MWLALFLWSFISHSNVRAGEFGYYGFPIIALVYAFYRRSSDTTKLRDNLDEQGLKHDNADA